MGSLLFILQVQILSRTSLIKQPCWLVCKLWSSIMTGMQDTQALRDSVEVRKNQEPDKVALLNDYL